MAKIVTTLIREYKQNMKVNFGKNWIDIADFTNETVSNILKEFLKKNPNNFDLVAFMIEDTTCTDPIVAMLVYLYSADSTKGEQYKQLGKLISERNDISEITRELLA